jgi:hypothetical protein
MTRAKHSSVTIDGITGAPDRPPPKIKLNNIEDVRREMATIYREARLGKVDIIRTRKASSSFGSERLCHCLGCRDRRA